VEKPRDTSNWFLFLRVTSCCVYYYNLFGFRQSQCTFRMFFITIPYPIHVSAPTGHFQVEYIYINKNVTVRLCTIVTQNRKSPKVVHRWRCHLDTTLQANTRVFLYTYNVYILYLCENMHLSFDGQEMALVVNEKHVVPFQANRWRCV
jgi:hypothetical protein